MKPDFKRDKKRIEELENKTEELENFTSAKRVVGKLNNGKLVYNKFVVLRAPDTSDGSYATTEIEIDDNVDMAFIKYGFITSKTGQRIQTPYRTNSGYEIKALISSENKAQITSNSAYFSNDYVTLSVCYTQET